jgi:tartrate dehydrogenase/decarboxylase/D-malate dehydrogenase
MSPESDPPPGKQSKTYKIAAIPGDGIGKEVIAAGLEVLNACSVADRGFSLESQTFDWMVS